MHDDCNFHNPHLKDRDCHNVYIYMGSNNKLITQANCFDDMPTIKFFDFKSQTTPTLYTNKQTIFNIFYMFQLSGIYKFHFLTSF